MNRTIAIGALAIIIVSALALTALNLSTGGVSLDVWGVRLTSRNPVRPFCVAGFAAALMVHLWARASRRWTRLVEISRRERVHSIVAGIAAGVVVVAGILHGSFVASAADSYGYIAASNLFTRGGLAIPQELASHFDWPYAESVWSPLGFQPSLDGRQIVPTYPAGLPLLMAGAQRLFGHGGGSLVVPFAAGVAVLATFWLGRRLESSQVGVLAAVLLACSPALLFHACIPMSDVPATAMWTVAVLLSLGGRSASVLAAGLSAGLALLIRPNLAPLAVVPLAGAVLFPHSVDRSVTRTLLLFCTGLIPGSLVLAWLNDAWYGSPIGTSYPIHEAFRLEFFSDNAVSYPKWLIETQTAFVLLAPIALLRPNRSRVLLFAMVALVSLCYAFYSPFDDWTFLRFLLPAFPALLILASISGVRLLTALRGASAQVVGLTLLAAVALTSSQEARIRGAFVNHTNLERFVKIPQYLDATLPENAVFLTRLYSGSIREYGSRLTLRWDILDPAWLDRCIEDLDRMGYRTFIVIERSEERDMFIERFGALNEWGRLDWPAWAEYRGNETVWIYDVRNLGRQPGELATRIIEN